MSITKGNLINAIPGGGESGLTAAHLLLLEHLSYNAAQDQVEADVSFSTILNTLKLSEQWGISSGDTTLVFSSTALDAQLVPLVQGVRDPTNPDNWGASGVIKPQARIYSDDVLFSGIRQGGSALDPDGGAVPYEGISLLASNLSVYAVRGVSAEFIGIGDKVRYKIWQGGDDTGDLILSQDLIATSDHEPGFDFTMWWSHLAEGLTGTTIFARATIQPPGGVERVLLVQANMDGGHWNSLVFRTYTMEVVILQPELLTLELASLSAGYTDGLLDPNVGFLLGANGVLVKADIPALTFRDRDEGVGRPRTMNVQLWAEDNSDNIHDFYFTIRKDMWNTPGRRACITGTNAGVEINNVTIDFRIQENDGTWHDLVLPIVDNEIKRFRFYRTATDVFFTDGVTTITATAPSGWATYALDVLTGPNDDATNIYVQFRDIESYLGAKHPDNVLMTWDCNGNNSVVGNIPAITWGVAPGEYSPMTRNF